MARKSLRVPTLIFLSFTVALVAQASQTNASYRLAQDWKASLGPRGEGSYIFRVAVCADGSAFLSDGRGRLIRINSQGEKTNDQSGIVQLTTTVSLACDSNGRAVAGTTATAALTVVESRPDKGFAIVARIKPQPLVAPFEILPLSKDQGYIVLGIGNNSKEPVHKLSVTGQVEANFGDVTAQPTEHLSIRAAVNGTLLWDDVHQSVLYLPENTYTLSEFTPGGDKLGQGNRAEAGFRTVQLDPGTGRALPNDRIVRAAMLPSGNILVQVVKHDPIGPSTVSSSTYLEVVDTALSRKAQVIGDAPGHLWGSDSKGGIYFTSISTADGLNVIKAHLPEVSQ